MEEQRRMHDDVRRWFYDGFKATDSIYKEEDCIGNGSGGRKNA